MKVGHNQSLRFQAWAHPREGLSLDDLAARLGESVREVHRACRCIGSCDCGATHVEGATHPATDHLLIAEATQ